MVRIAQHSTDPAAIAPPLQRITTSYVRLPTGYPKINCHGRVTLGQLAGQLNDTWVSRSAVLRCRLLALHGSGAAFNKYPSHSEASWQPVCDHPR